MCQEGGERDVMRKERKRERRREIWGRVRKTNSGQNYFAWRHTVVFHFIERRRMNSPQNATKRRHRELDPHPADGIDKSSLWLLWVASDCSLHQDGGASRLFSRHLDGFGRLMDAYCLHMKSSYPIIQTQFICRRAVTSRLYAILHSRTQSYKWQMRTRALPL